MVIRLIGITDIYDISVLLKRRYEKIGRKKNIKNNKFCVSFLQDLVSRNSKIESTFNAKNSIPCPKHENKNSYSSEY